MTNIQSQFISVPLDKDAHNWAEIFAAEQDTPQKGKQVYLNTLAVYAVHNYLKWLMVETDLTQGDSWHPSLRILFDVSDLVIPNVGKLECRPVLPGKTAFDLPLEVTQDRIGYVGVQFYQQLDSVQLLGFVSATVYNEPPQEIYLAQLQPLDALIETICTIPNKQVENFLAIPEPLLVNLRQWFEGIFYQDWQPAERLLAGSYRFKKSTSTTNSVSRAKEFYLGGQPLVLTVKLMPTVSDTIDIRLRLYPGSNAVHLPENLQLILFDESGCACLEAQSKKTDNWMELEFSCQFGERFSTKVVLGRTSLTEKFVV